MFACTKSKFNYMKKAIMFIALVAASVAGANAQKFQGGEKNLEVTFSPLSENPIGIEGIRFRMFNSESSAIRVGFNINGGKNTSVIQQPYDVENGANDVAKSELYATTKNFGFSIRPGYEKHFAGTDRLSPYVGAELVFSMNSSSYSEEYHSGNTADNMADDNGAYTEAAKWSTWNIERKEGSRTFGLNAVAGADFYFADNFYLGAEISLGFRGTNWKDSEISVSSPEAYALYEPSTTTVIVDEVEVDVFNNANGLRPIADTFEQMLGEDASGKMKILTIVGDGTGNSKNSSWGPTAQATLRLGWLF
jgi:hypothetical protein